VLEFAASLIRLVPAFALFSLFTTHVSLVARQGNCTGTLSGTVASVEVDRIGEVAADVPRAKLSFQFKSKEVSVNADDNGDYYGTSLECGEYRLKRVVNREGTNLRTVRSQHSEFSVRRDQVTRFDVIVLGMKGR